MGAVFRIGIHWKAPAGSQRSSLADRRWSLAALDPASHVRCGSLEASDGAIIPYRLWAAERPTRALVILLHGAFDYSAAFDEIGPRLVQRGFAAIAFDQRGFGGTVSRGRWRGRARMVRDVVDVTAFVRERYGESLPLFMIGESMGAALAVLVAAQFPGLNVSGLVLTAPGALAGRLRRTVVAAFLQALRWLAPVGAVVCERVSGRELTAGAAIRLLMDPLVLRTVSAAMIFGLAGLAQSAVDEADAVQVPTLTMAGTKDEFVRIGCMKQLYRRFVGPKQWTTFDGGPHLLLHWQHGDRVVAEAIEWMEHWMQPTAPVGATSNSGNSAMRTCGRCRPEGQSPIASRARFRRCCSLRLPRLVSQIR